MAKDSATRGVWNIAFGKECGNFAQGDYKIEKKGKNSLFVLDHNKIRQIPTDLTVTYANISVDYSPQNKDPNRVRITSGRNLINYPGEITTRAADLTSSEILWNSIISIINTKRMCVYMKNIYLLNILYLYEYM